MNSPTVEALTPDPDPSWDYYELYQAILDSKARFDELLLTISLCDTANTHSDIKFRTALDQLKDDVQNIVNHFLADEDIYDE